MADRPVLDQLVDRLLRERGTTLDDLLSTRRQTRAATGQRISYRAIAAELTTITGVSVSYASVDRWCKARDIP